MNNRIRLRNPRPKAFWGALIGAAASVAGSLIQGNAQKKAAKQQQQAEQLKQNQQLAANMTQNMNDATALQNSYEQMFRSNFRRGGRVKCGLGWLGSILPAVGSAVGSIVDGAISKGKVDLSKLDTTTDINKVGYPQAKYGITVQRGGNIQPIRHNTFLLRGRSHDDVNRFGESGIYLNLGGKDVEAEGGEVLQKHGNEYRIFSDRIGYNGESFADHVIDGENPDKVFNMQEKIKRRRLRNGGTSTPVGRSCAAYGDSYPINWFDLDPGFWTRELGATAAYPKRYGIRYEPTAPYPRTIRINGIPVQVPSSNAATLRREIPSALQFKYPGLGDANPDFLMTDEEKKARDYNWRVRLANQTPVNFDPNTGEIIQDAAKEAALGEANGKSTWLPWGMSTTYGDILNTGIGVLGSILSHTATRAGLRGLEKYAPTSPIGIQASKLKTFYNINPQLEVAERYNDKTKKAILDNTISSAAAVNKIGANNLNTVDVKNQLYADKENKETEMINRDALNQQQVRAQNAYMYNQYLDRLNNFRLGLANARMQSNVGLIQGIGSSLSNLIQSGMDRYNDENALIAYTAASEKGTPERLVQFGYPMFQRALRGIYMTNDNEQSRNLIRPRLSRYSTNWLRNRNYNV